MPEIIKKLLNFVKKLVVLFFSVHDVKMGHICTMRLNIGSGCIQGHWLVSAAWWSNRNGQHKNFYNILHCCLLFDWLFGIIVCRRWWKIVGNVCTKSTIIWAVNLLSVIDLALCIFYVIVYCHLIVWHDFCFCDCLGCKSSTLWVFLLTTYLLT